MSRKNLVINNHSVGKNPNKQQQQKMAIILVAGLLLLLFLFLAAMNWYNKRPRTYDELLPMMDDAIAYQVGVADQFKIYDGVDAQVGEQNYNTFLGIPQEGADPSVTAYVEDKYASSVYETESVLDDVKKSEDEVRAAGGVVTVGDMEKYRVAPGFELDRPH